MRPIQQTSVYTAGDPNGIAAGVATVAGVPITLLLSTLDAQRRIGIIATTSVTAVTFVIVGTDGQGRSITESLVGGGAGVSVQTKLDFLTIVSITPSATHAATDIDIGTSVGNATITAISPRVGGGIIVPVDLGVDPTNIGVGIIFTDGATPTTAAAIEHTFDDIWDPAVIPNWIFNTTFGTTGIMLSSTALQFDGNYQAPPRAVRLVIGSGTGTVVWTLVQSGIAS